MKKVWSPGVLTVAVLLATLVASPVYGGNHDNEEITGINAAVRVGYDSGTVKFANQVIFESKRAVILGGDSGSLLVPTPPAAPINLTATAVSSCQINLAWTDKSDDEDGFKIERSTAYNTSPPQIATTALNAISYSDTGLADSTNYFYRVWAFNTGGNSAYASAYATTQASLGVFDIRWNSSKNLEFVVNVRRDSNCDVSLTNPPDSPVARAWVNATLTHDTNLSGTFDCNAGDTCWNFYGPTDGNGNRLFKLIGTPSGYYKAEVTYMNHVTYHWRGNLDVDNPDYFTR